jgi:pyrrolidone-carboxylate peptidase
VGDPWLRNDSSSCAWEFVKSIPKNILEGKDLIHVSLPVALNEPRSFLERMADTMAFLPIYLTKAAGNPPPPPR